MRGEFSETVRRTGVPLPAVPARANGVNVVLPVLDEIDAIAWVLERMPPGYRPIVVDNGSTDGSGARARELGAEVVIEPQRGFGAACQAGLRAATADVVCFMDCDGSLDPAGLPAVVAPVLSGMLDLCLGARRAAPGAWPGHARAANHFLAGVLRHRHGLRLRDLGPMRAARREALADLDLRDRRFGWPLEMVVRAAEKGWRIGEVPVGYAPRIGRSKVTGTVRGTVRAVRDMAEVLR
jgi:dTDP-L-rhamnose 4-epimerase